MVTAQIQSKQRVEQHGEVLTGEREVNAMLDLVKQETERIESRFLEPACGTGNFLVEILRRKLSLVDSRYRRSQLEWERNAVLAVSSVYGIELLDDNAQTCRERLFHIFDTMYTRRYKDKARDQCRDSARYLLDRNIIRGDALSLQTVGPDPQPIVFSEWSPLNGSLLKRRDFAFHELLPEPPKIAPNPLGSIQRSLFGEVQGSLFEHNQNALVSDTGQSVFIAEPVRDYPLVHFLEVANAYD